MQKVGMFKTKTHLPELIRQVQKGQQTCLTNRSQEVAIIVPIRALQQRKKSSIFKELKDLLKKSPLGTVDEIISMKEEEKK